jgi:hypothetical protein
MKMEARKQLIKTEFNGKTLVEFSIKERNLLTLYSALVASVVVLVAVKFFI